jgi:dihydrofolate reductase
MAAIRGYMAASLDGYIADRDGGLDWLRPFEELDLGYPDFIAQVGVTVMGRKTYDRIESLGGDWPYEKQRSIVVSSRPIADPPPNTTLWHEGVPALAGHLRALREGDIWIVGGSTLQSAMLDIGALDRLELFVIPVLLGRGVPVFRHLVHQRQAVLQSTRAMDGGVAKLDYRFRTADAYFER